MCKRAMNAKGLVKIQKLTKAKAEVCAAIEAQRILSFTIALRRQLVTAIFKPKGIPC